MQEEINKKIQATENRMRECSLSLERLNQEYQQLLNDLGLTQEQLKARVENRDHYTPQEWEEMQQEQKRLDEKLNLELAHLTDPLKTKEAFSSVKTIQQHWLFVR